MLSARHNTPFSITTRHTVTKAELFCSDKCYTLSYNNTPHSDQSWTVLFRPMFTRKTALRVYSLLVSFFKNWPPVIILQINETSREVSWSYCQSVIVLSLLLYSNFDRRWSLSGHVSPSRSGTCPWRKLRSQKYVSVQRRFMVGNNRCWTNVGLMLVHCLTRLR